MASLHGPLRLSASSRKRVRDALEVGDRKRALQELKDSCQASDEDIEAYLRYLEETDAQLQFEAVFGKQEDDSLEDELIESLNSLEIDAVLCPLCFKGSLTKWDP